MTAKEYFKMLSDMKTQIASKQERIQMLKEIASGIGSSVLTGMPKNPNPTNSHMADVLCKALSLEEELAEEEALLAAKKAELLDFIGKINNLDCQTILIHRYLRGYTWEDITNKMGYTKRWVYELHNRALTELDAILSKETD